MPARAHSEHAGPTRRTSLGAILLRSSCALVLAGTGLLLFYQPGPAQQTQDIVVDNFKVASPDYYPPPNERQSKWLLEGARAQPLPAGRVRVTQAKLTMFKESGQPEMQISAPVCDYDQATRSIFSPGLLDVKSADGAFSLSGEGFLWTQTKNLAISNRVVTGLQPELLSGGSRTNEAGQTGPVRISSDRFFYSADTGLGTYDKNVRVVSTNLLLTSESLNFKLPIKERQVQTVSAEQHVVLDYEAVERKIHATGEHATWTAATGLVRVWGEPQWQSGLQEGRGDEIIIDRTNRVFRTQGNAFIRLPAEGTGRAGFLGTFGPAEQSGATNRFIEIRCQTCEVRTNVAVFTRNVHAVQTAGEQVQGRLSCALLTVTYSGQNELQRMMAEDHVVIEQGDKQVRGGLAVYDAPSGELRVTEKPAWRAGEREGAGEELLVKTLADEMDVQTNAWLRLPANELGQFQTSGSPGTAGTLPAGGTNSFAEVFADEYRLALTELRFSGHVRLRHPQMICSSGFVTVQTPTQPGKPRRLVATPYVLFDLKDQKGQKVHGTGERAVYTQNQGPTITNSLLELTGSPAVLEMTNGVVLQNRVLFLDLASNRFIVPPGGYRVAGPTNLVGTNVFRLPKTRGSR